MELISVASETLGHRVCREKEMKARRIPIALATAPRALLMVHGFNTSDEDASREYRHFENRLKAAIGFRDLAAVGQLCGLIWPGHHDVGLISKATFSSRIPDAETSGLRLAEVLQRMDRNHEVILVGHSLGCRVVLEALGQIREWEDLYTGPNISHVFLLAAAVPESHCGEGAAYEPGSEIASREHVLFSEMDSVLKLAFPVGQYLYDDDDRLRQPGSGAVGRRGGPTGRWLSSHKMTLDHGDYWSSSRVASTIVNAMGISGVIEPAFRSLPETAAVKEVRRAGGSTIPENSIPSRARR